MMFNVDYSKGATGEELSVTKEKQIIKEEKKELSFTEAHVDSTLPKQNCTVENETEFE